MQSLQPFHTFHIDAKAQQIIEATSIDELSQAWRQAKAAGLPVLLLGSGSNMLFLADFQGCVIVNKLQGIKHQEDADFHYLHVAGGENWHQLIEWALAQQIAGLENLALIPGVAGSAPIQNIGAYGLEFKDVCDYVDVLNLQSGEVFRLTRDECQFGYRDSIFKHQYREGFAVVAVGLKLAKAWQPILKYGSLTAFDAATVTPQEVFAEVCKIRREKLPDPQLLGNAGSFFKNPVISKEQFAKIQAKYPTIPHYPQADGQVKLAAGWLIDNCHLKGQQVGAAAVHEKQALVLVNLGTATSADVVALAALVRQTVAEKFAVYLAPEVRFMGAQAEVDAVAAISGEIQ